MDSNLAFGATAKQLQEQQKQQQQNWKKEEYQTLLKTEAGSLLSSLSSLVSERKNFRSGNEANVTQESYILQDKSS
jgi:hypothetical protein